MVLKWLELHREDFFKRFTVKFNTLEEENGADFAPEYRFFLPEC